MLSLPQRFKLVAGMTLKNKKLLLVDDEFDLLEVMKVHLEIQGADVTLARSGDEAFKILQGSSFDMIISDVRMPGGDGPSLLRRLRESSLPQPMFIFMTGFSDIPAETLKVGAQDVIHKPFDFQDLGRLIGHYLNPAS